jgi:hypothetical protein
LSYPWWSLYSSLAPASALKIERDVDMAESNQNFHVPVQPSISETTSAASGTAPIVSSVSHKVPSTTTAADSSGFSEEADSDTESSPYYRTLRKSRENHSSRDNALAYACSSLVSLPLLVVVEAEGDGGCSKGWYCACCGRFNRQTMFRRRKCGSSFCSKAVMTPCAVVELDVIRTPGDRIPIFLPANRLSKCLSWIDPRLVEWEDGMKTLVYELRQVSGQGESVEAVDVGMSKGITMDLATSGCARQEKASRPVFISHVFTRNLPRLQAEQTFLFTEIQKEVVLGRGEHDLSEYAAVL